MSFNRRRAQSALGFFFWVGAIGVELIAIVGGGFNGGVAGALIFGLIGILYVMALYVVLAIGSAVFDCANYLEQLTDTLEGDREVLPLRPPARAVQRAAPAPATAVVREEPVDIDKLLAEHGDDPVPHVKKPAQRRLHR